MLTPMFSLHYSEEYGRVATAFMRGAEFGYKEAINIAKEWLTIKGVFNGNTCGDLKQYVADFETDMNKLLEEKK